MLFIPGMLLSWSSLVCSFEPPTTDDANVLLEQRKWAEAIVAFEQIIKAQPNNSEAWFNLGRALHSDGQLDRAIEVNRKAASFSDVKASALYNIACAYALKERAFAALDRAQQAGFRNLTEIRSDPDLKSLRGDDRFKQLRGHEYFDMKMEDGVKLQYAVQLPDNFDASKTYPVLLALPPGSQSQGAVEVGLRMFWGAQAAKRGWIVVSPIKPEGGWYKKRAGRYMRQLLDALEGRYNLEGGKFHIAGCSGGGPSAFHIAIDSPRRFHSLTGIPGYPRKTRDFDRLERLRNVRVRMFVGGNDRGWQKSLRRTQSKLEELGCDSTLTVFSNEGHVMDSLVGEGFMQRLDELRVRER